MLCFGNRQRRSLAPWGLCLIIFTIMSTGICESNVDPFADVDTFSLSSSSSSIPSPRKTLGEEIGSPSELAWQAWLLVENNGGGHSAFDSSNILRRITPKSIFIAPELISCPSGFSSDGKGVCKPDPISIDEDAQRQFVLKRLNAKFGMFANNRKKPSDTSGPLQINIPISIPAKINPPEIQPVQLPPQQQQPQMSIHETPQEIMTDDRLAIPMLIPEQSPIQSNNKSQDAVAVVIYKVANETKKEEKESGIMNYKIPVDLKTIFNKSDIFDEQKTSSNRQPTEKKDRLNSMEDSSPTVVLLLSPTKLPLMISTQKDTETTKINITDQSPAEQEPEQIENTTIRATENETKAEFDSTVQTVSPLDVQTAVDLADSTVRSTEKAYTEDRIEDETVYADDESQTEQESEDHEDYDDTTDGTDQDEFAENEDELLKPGEAGMMISPKNQDLIRSKTQKLHMSTIVQDVQDPTSTTNMDTTTTPTLPTIDADSTLDFSDSTIETDATDYTKGDTTTIQTTTEITSTITTTEATTEETTVFTTRPLRVKNLVKINVRTIPTQIPITTTVSQEKMDSKGLIQAERELVTEPEVILSTQTGHRMTNAFGRKKPTYPAKIMEVPYTLEDLIVRTEPPPPLNFNHRHPADHKRQKPPIPINDESSIIFKDDDNISAFEFGDQIAESSKATIDFKKIPSSISDQPSFVRFPEENSESRSQPQSYVKFPSDEVNSIHNQDIFKDHFLSSYFSRDNYGNGSPTSTKSSVSTRQKLPSVYRRIPTSNIRWNRQQQQMETTSSSGNQRQQKQKPMLFGLWSRMSHVRDFNFYPTTSHGSHNEPIGGEEDNHRINSRFSSITESPTVNYYKDISSYEAATGG